MTQNDEQEAHEIPEAVQEEHVDNIDEYSAVAS
jgi:hypothetical protein